ncbi:CDP-glycerol glycerophosphotransferase family protein [bacterium]|nr:CDP-glycerol glycerophosphotransferase family protein [bacterium]
MISDNSIEKTDLKAIYSSPYINWKFFKNSTVLVTGGTGMIGSLLIKSLLYANEILQTNIKIIATVRDKKKLQKIFPKYPFNELKFIFQDIEQNLKIKGKVDFIIHTANTTSSKDFVENPVETISSIIAGTKNILNFAKEKKVKSVVYLSSMEVFGDVPFSREEKLKEEDYGYIDILKPRSSYPEGKRCAENLCASYYREYGVPVKIARLVQTVGANVNYDDKRVWAEFTRCITEKQDIVLKTQGEAIRSYLYVTDAIVAILAMLEKGKDGESYNITNPEATCSIKELAQMLCEKYPDSKLRIEPDDKYYPNPSKYIIDGSKFEELTSWQAQVPLIEMFNRLVQRFYFLKYSDNFKNEKLTLLQRLFSISNVGYYKIIYILGLAIKLDRTAYYKRAMKCAIQSNKIIFCNFKGGLYACNPKYITEEILKQKLPYELVWLTNNAEKREKDFPKDVKVVDFRSKEALKELATAKIWVDNQRKIFHIRRGLVKRDEQAYIQTWHGSLGIKKVGEDSNFTKVNNIWVQDGLKDAEMTDFLISNSTFEDEVFDKNFWHHGEILKYGHARNDIFFKSQEEQKAIKERIYKALGIPADKKLFLYAPSYRDDFRIDCYNIDIDGIRNALSDRFGGSWVIATRLHPEIALYDKGGDKLFDFNENLINASLYPDIQELLVSADAGLTDYSSWIFDYMLSRKPAFIYAEDIEKYNTDRGFYYPLESTPFPVSKDNKGLINNILNFDNDKYVKEVDTFLKDKGCMDDGKASERIVKLIGDIINAKV